MYKDNEFIIKKTISYSQLKCYAILLSVFVCTLACLHLNKLQKWFQLNLNYACSLISETKPGIYSSY